MELILCRDSKELCLAPAIWIWQEIEHRPSCRLLVSGSPICCQVLKRMGECAAQDGGGLDHVRIFLVGEYLGLAPNHDQSCCFQVMLATAAWPGFDRSAILSPGVLRTAEACFEYERALTGCGGMDLALLELSSGGRLKFSAMADLHWPGRTSLVEIPDEQVEEHARFFERYSNAPRQAILTGSIHARAAGALIAVAENATSLSIEDRLIVPEQPGAGLLRQHPKLRLYVNRQGSGCRDLEMPDEVERRVIKL